MPVNLSIKNVPDALADQLRQRAERSHRSLQGELMSILEEAVYGRAALDPTEVLHLVSGLGLKTPTESVAMIRGDRDGR